jgi:LysR family transcriptional regulator, regulator for bpeEF and oprC
LQGLQQFLAFAQTARRGSIAAAARDLGVARLETELGVKLFHRCERVLAPDAMGGRTPEGASFNPTRLA